jgi:hypothetical protein
MKSLFSVVVSSDTFSSLRIILVFQCFQCSPRLKTQERELEEQLRAVRQRRQQLQKI